MDGTIPTNPGGGGPTLDAEVVTRNDDAGTTVYRERNQLTGDTPEAIAQVVNEEPANTAYGPVVRVVGGVYIATDQWNRLIGALEQIAKNTSYIASTLSAE